MYLKAWLGILLPVNHKDKKVLVCGELIECKRGQSILSLSGWSKCFGKGWTMQRVRTFFELLKNDSMINTEGLRKTTRLTVCNYDSYQFEQQTKNKHKTSKEQGDNNEITTNKNDKNEENDKKNIVYSEFYDSELLKCGNDEISRMYRSLVEYLYGKNPINQELTDWTKLKLQLTRDQFETLYPKYKERGIRIIDKLLSGANNPSNLKNKVSVYLTLNNWASDKWSKATTK